MSEEKLEPTDSEEYELMLTLEQLESLEEELEEVGFGTLAEIETVLALSPSNGAAPDERTELLRDIREQMLLLNVSNRKELKDHIRKLNEQLDELEG